MSQTKKYSANIISFFTQKRNIFWRKYDFYSEIFTFLAVFTNKFMKATYSFAHLRNERHTIFSVWISRIKKACFKLICYHLKQDFLLV